MLSILQLTFHVLKTILLIVYLGISCESSMAGALPPTNVPKAMDDPAGDGRWLSQHQRFLTETHDQEPEVLFLGDSLIQRLQDSDVWRELFQPLHCLNFGIGGETTQNLLWRIVNGALEVIKPKVIVLLVGTNNFHNSAEEVAEGIVEIVRVIREKQPQAQVVVVELFPRGERPNVQREKVARTNRLVREQLRSVPQTQVVCLDPGFVSEEGLINPQDMPDYLHLSNKAYKKAFEPLREIVIGFLDPAELPTERDAETCSTRSTRSMGSTGSTGSTRRESAGPVEGDPT